MPRLLERGLTGIFRSRWGVAVVLGVLVVAVVGIGRLFADDSGGTPLTSTGTATPSVSVDPDGDDGVISPEPPRPTTSPGTAQPEAVAYAFAQAWVDHDGVTAQAWHDGLVPNATTDLADELADTDPADVPASRVLERPRLIPVSDGLIDATVDLDTGTLTLRLSAPEGRWLVDGIDWEGS